MFELFVERFDSHRTNPFGNQVTDGIVDHRGSDTSVQPKAVREIGCDIEFAAADMNLAFMGLAERNNSGIESMDECPQREKVQSASGGNLQHGVSLRS